MSELKPSPRVSATLIDSVAVELEALLGQAKMTVGALTALKPGAVVPLEAALNRPVELRLGEAIVARVVLRLLIGPDDPAAQPVPARAGTYRDRTIGVHPGADDRRIGDGGLRCLRLRDCGRGGGQQRCGEGRGKSNERHEQSPVIVHDYRSTGCRSVDAG